MPWKEIDVMDQKKAFVFKSFEHLESFTDLCRDFCISTKTGYKWLERFRKKGYEGLEELSRKPVSNGLELPSSIVLELVALKNRHMKWGARKIHRLYHDAHPGITSPVISTVARVLEKAGLVQRKKRRRVKVTTRIQNRMIPKEPNDLWTVDFKGWWYTPNKDKVNPLTVRDEYSKGILAITVIEKADSLSIRKEFERIFSLYGLPKCIRSDNGPPFASHFNALGLTKLAVWWMSLGIQLDRIDPGCPYQNGAHERMHLDMMRELEGHIHGDLEEHQRAFDIWRNEFNRERPHESLDYKRPSEVYTLSERHFDPGIEDIEYPSPLKPRKVNNRGVFTFQKKKYFIGNPFDGYSVGLNLLSNQKTEVWFSHFKLGILDPNSSLIVYETRDKIINVS